MLVENGYGKTYSIRVEDYLDLTDEDLQFIVAENYGEEIDNPFIMPFSDLKEKDYSDFYNKEDNFEEFFEKE